MTSIDRDNKDFTDKKKEDLRVAIETFHKHVEKYRQYNFPKIATIFVRIIYISTGIFYLSLFIGESFFGQITNKFYDYGVISHFLKFVEDNPQSALTLYLIAPLILLIFNSLKDITDKLTETAAKVTTNKETTAEKTVRHLENLLACMNENYAVKSPPVELADYRNALNSIGWAGDQERLLLNFHDVPEMVHETKVRLNTLISYIVILVCTGPMLYFLYDTLYSRYISGVAIIAIYIIIFLLFMEARQKIICLRYILAATDALKKGSEYFQNKRDLGF